MIFATGYDVDVPWLDEGVLEYQDGHPVNTMGTFLPGVSNLYLAGALHFAGNTFSVFDMTIQIAAAHAEAVLAGDSVRASALEDFTPDLRGDFPFLNTRRNTNQVHIPALEAAFQTLREQYQVEVPRYGDHAFYRNVSKDSDMASDEEASELLVTGAR